MTYKFLSFSGEKVFIKQLTQAICMDNSQELLDIINIIPFIHWSYDELISQKLDYYNNKWNYSYIATNENNIIIGVLIAYFRRADSKNIFDSLYLHRLAIRPDYQKMGIGTELLRYFINTAFVNIPWLLNITAQTNDNASNGYVLRFYHEFGFQDMYHVQYSNKLDILMLLERHRYNFDISRYMNETTISLCHPRFTGCFNAPKIFFATTNQKKKEMIQFIFHNYNIDVKFVKPPIELIEPQIEKPVAEEEQKLVSVPLKAVSRFVNGSVPYIIEDTMLFAEYFNNCEKWELPGFDTKRWLRQMGLDGFLQIMGDTTKRKAKFVSQVGSYVKSHTYYFGRGELFGSISYKKAEVINPKYGTYPYFFHLIFIPDGATKTLAEMDMFEYAQYDYMRKGIVQLIAEFDSQAFFAEEYQFTIFDYCMEEK